MCQLAAAHGEGTSGVLVTLLFAPNLFLWDSFQNRLLDTARTVARLMNLKRVVDIERVILFLCVYRFLVPEPDSVIYRSRVSVCCGVISKFRHYKECPEGPELEKHQPEESGDYVLSESVVYGLWGLETPPVKGNAQLWCLSLDGVWWLAWLLLRKMLKVMDGWTFITHKQEGEHPTLMLITG